MEKGETCNHHGLASHTEPKKHVAYHGNRLGFGAMKTECGVLSHRSAIADLEASIDRLKLTNDCQVVERVCQLLHQHGRDLETNNKDKLSELFKTLKCVAGSTRVDVRSRLLLLQLFKQRASGWGHSTKPPANNGSNVLDQRLQGKVEGTTSVSCTTTTTIPPRCVPQSTTSVCSPTSPISPRYVPQSTTSVCSPTSPIPPRYVPQSTTSVCSPTSPIPPRYVPQSTTSVCSPTSPISPRYEAAAQPQKSNVTLILNKHQAQRLILKGKLALQDVCMSCQVEVTFHQEANSNYIKAALIGSDAGIEEAKIKLYDLIQEDNDVAIEPPCLHKHEEEPKPEKDGCSTIAPVPVPNLRITKIENDWDIHVQNESVPGFFLHNKNKRDSRWKRSVPQRTITKESSDSNDVSSEITDSKSSSKKRVYSREFLLSCWHSSTTHTIPPDLLTTDKCILVSDMRWQPNPIDLLHPEDSWRDTGFSFAQSRRMFMDRESL